MKLENVDWFILHGVVFMTEKEYIRRHGEFIKDE